MMSQAHRYPEQHSGDWAEQTATEYNANLMFYNKPMPLQRNSKKLI